MISETSSTAFIGAVVGILSGRSLVLMSITEINLIIVS